ncbi:MAG: carboxypeptidase regulatory-like domain-containing protein [Planctomycetes bacterium]|nr:carboxypeptidase regulatory-like domain-containing protein [Planctomycetota bacterium]
MEDALVGFGRRLAACASVLLAACGAATEPASAPTAAAPTLGALRGRVVDSQGHPAAGLELEAHAEGGEPTDDVAARVRALGEPAASEPGSEWSVARTEQDGSFELRGLRAGRYSVFARTSVGQNSLHRLTRELVDSSTNTELTLALVSPRLVVRLVDPDGAPWTGLARLPESDHVPDHWPAEPWLVVAPVREDAEFRSEWAPYLTGVPSDGGEYVFECAANVRYQLGLFGGGQTWSASDVYVPLGASWVDVELTRRPDAANGKLIVHARGANVAEVDVSARLRLEDPESGFPLVDAPTSVGAQSPWHLNLPAGEYRVAVEGCAVLDDYHGTLERARDLGRFEARVRVEAGRETTLDALVPAGARLHLALRGTANDADRASPDATEWGFPRESGAELATLQLVAAQRWPLPVLFRHPNGAEPEADGYLCPFLALGRTEFSEILPAGRYELVARLPGGRVARAPVELVDGRVTDVELAFD